MQEHFIDVDGNRIRYLDSGVSKNNLVLLHGLGASAERWSKVIPDFAKHYHVIVPDMIGFGYSDKPLADYTPDFFTAFLGKFFDALEIKKPN
ncbi:MAG: alpha/beta fold hydrolase, partial [Nitrosarchaeum sp.]